MRYFALLTLSGDLLHLERGLFVLIDLLLGAKNITLYIIRRVKYKYDVFQPRKNFKYKQSSFRFNIVLSSKPFDKEQVNVYIEEKLVSVVLLLVQYSFHYSV